MTVYSKELETEIIYPSSDGEPMAESDLARDYLIYGVEALDIYFQNREDVYVSGNSFVYYKKGVPKAVVSPDVYVVFGVEKKKRMSYKVWEEENKVPDFVMEITSRKTKKIDEESKPKKYAKLGVREYFQYDPTGDYLEPQLKGSRLVEKNYRSIPSSILTDEILSIHSEVLGLDLRLISGELRFFDPQTGQKLLSYKETELARQQAELARQQAELDRQQAEFDRQQAEFDRQQAELARRNAIPRLLGLGLSAEQIAETLSLSAEEVRQFER